MDESRIADDPALAESSASRVPVRSISLAIIVAVVLYVSMVTLADRESFVATVLALPGMLWVHVVMLSLASYLLRFARWHLFIVALGHNVPILRNLEIYLAGFALTLTPGKVGETVRSVYLNSYGVSYPESVGTFVSERLLDLVVVGVLACLTVFSFPEHLLLVIGTVVCCLAVMVILRARLLRIIAARLAKGSAEGYAFKWVKTMQFLMSGTRVSGALPLTLLAWSAQGISLYLTVEFLGYDLSAIGIIAIYCLSILAGAISFIPGGLGATEAAIAVLLSSAGLTQSDAVTASLVTRGLTLWLAVGVGVVAMSKIAVMNRALPIVKP